MRGSQKRDLPVCAPCVDEQRVFEARTTHTPRAFEPPDEIVPGLFLGSEHSATDLGALRALRLKKRLSRSLGSAWVESPSLSTALKTGVGAM